MNLAGVDYGVVENFMIDGHLTASTTTTGRSTIAPMPALHVGQPGILYTVNIGAHRIDIL